MKGTVSLGDVGSGTWTGKRQKPLRLCVLCVSAFSVSLR